MKHLNVLSLFDGMSCGRIALEDSGIPVKYYAASEIDKWGMKVSKHNYFDIDHVGDVCNLNPYDFRNINLIIGGSPCQSISAAGKLGGITTSDGQVVSSLEQYKFLKSMGYGYDTSKHRHFTASCLFWEYVRIYRGIKQYNPDVKFLLENVYNKFWGQLITQEMGVDPIRINSSSFVPQNRDRYYWTNIEYQPIRERHGLTLDTIIPDAVSGAGSRGVPQKNWTPTPENPFLHVQKTTVRKDQLANCLTASGANSCRQYLSQGGDIRVINIEQAEMLQTVPVGYTNAPGVSEHQRFRMLGNGWTVAVVAHFFTCLKLEIERKERVLV